MKINKLNYFLLLSVFCISINNISSQEIQPELSFIEFPKTHNAHITSDGKYLYTCNAGNSIKGKISKFDTKGNLIKNYGIQIDMRSIMYCKKDKYLYVSGYDQNIYKITDLENGIYQKINTDLIIDPQAAIALDTKGKSLYHFKDGILEIYTFPEGDLISQYEGLPCGDGFLTGNSVIAVSKKHFFTWNSDKQAIYAFNNRGEQVKTIKITKGSYGISLSYANGLLFVSDDGDYQDGTWYAYDVGLK